MYDNAYQLNMLMNDIFLVPESRNTVMTATDDNLFFAEHSSKPGFLWRVVLLFGTSWVPLSSSTASDLSWQSIFSSSDSSSRFSTFFCQMASKSTLFCLAAKFTIFFPSSNLPLAKNHRKDSLIYLFYL